MHLPVIWQASAFAVLFSQDSTAGKRSYTSHSNQGEVKVFIFIYFKGYWAKINFDLFSITRLILIFLNQTVFSKVKFLTGIVFVFIVLTQN